nr:unnamed protein product [Callosobruchus analis]
MTPAKIVGKTDRPRSYRLRLSSGNIVERNRSNIYKASTDDQVENDSHFILEDTSNLQSTSRFNDNTQEEAPILRSNIQSESNLIPEQPTTSSLCFVSCGESSDRYEEADSEEAYFGFSQTGPSITTSTQTYTCDEEEEKATKEIWEIIKEEKSWERCDEVMFRTWPSSAYRVTMEVDSNPLKLSGDRNFCVYVNNRVDINKGLAKQLREKINDL